MTASRPGEDVLVVIPCLNEERYLSGVLSGVLSEPGLDHALVVVADGGSTDRSPAIVAELATEDFRVKLLSNPKRFQSAGVNLAVSEFGRGRVWLVRMDAHASYPPRYTTRLVQAAVATEAESVVVPMITLGLECFQKAAAAAQNSLVGAGGAAHRRRGASRWVDHGHHALLRLSAFTQAGGYDEAFSHNEDAEFDLRLTGVGARIWLQDDLAITYFPRRTPLALFRQYLNHGAGRAKTLRLHLHRPRLRQILPLFVAPALAALALAPFASVFMLPALLWASVCLGFGLLLGIRRRDLCTAGSGLAAMCMHLGWSIGFWRELLRR